MSVRALQAPATLRLRRASVDYYVPNFVLVPEARPTKLFAHRPGVWTRFGKFRSRRRPEYFRFGQVYTPTPYRRARLGDRARSLASILSIAITVVFGSDYISQVAHFRDYPELSVSVTPMSSGLPDDLSAEMRRKVEADLSSYRTAQIVDHPYPEDVADARCLLNVDATIMVSDQAVIEWTLIDPVTRDAVSTGHEAFDPGRHRSMNHAADRIAGRILGSQGVVTHWVRTAGSGSSRRCDFTSLKAVA